MRPIVIMGVLSLVIGCERAPAGPPPPARPAVADAADWCAEHAVPESMCTQCNPALVPRYKAVDDYCAGHGFPESVCPLCHPLAPPATPAEQAEEAPGDWCAGHGLPESKCTKCNPALVARFKAAGDWCAEHGFPESACPTCNPVAPPASGPVAPGTVVRLQRPQLAGVAGIQTVAARAQVAASEVHAPARIDFDRDAVAEVRAPVSGVVRVVRVGLGQQVLAGDPLFELESVQVGDLQARRRSAKGRVGAARANLARQKGLQADAIASKRALELAQRELAAAQAELKGIEQSLSLSGAGRGAGRFVVTAPLAGEVVRRPAVVGVFAEPALRLATVADTQRMWALLDLTPADAARVRRGQRATVRVEGGPARALTGTVDWLAPEVDPRTRRVTARVGLTNPGGAVRAGQFAQATVQVGGSAKGVAVPRTAVQRVGGGAVVFVQTDPGVYTPRSVQPGAAVGRWVLVGGDVRPGEPVVTTGAYLLRTELDRGAIGAGCCDVDGAGE